jgi:hypothetical protein
MGTATNRTKASGRRALMLYSPFYPGSSSMMSMQAMAQGWLPL